MEVSMHQQINIKQFIAKKVRQKRTGFALLYVMLFIFLILVTVVITWATSMAENRLNQRTEGGAEAYQLAQAAIDEGWIKYHDLIGDRCIIDIIDNPGKVGRFLVGESKDVDTDFGSTVSFSDSLKGVYDFRITYEMIPYHITKQQVIEGIGYYQGTKITLKGSVKHDTNLDNEIVFDNSIPPVCESRNHENDTLLIYQTGPSGS